LARQDFIQSMQEQPSDVNAAWMVSYSDMLMLQQRPGIEMAQRLEDIATLSPSLFNPEAHLCRGVALLLKDNPSEALVELDKAIQLALEAQETPFWKGVACAYLERYEDAVDAIQTSLANDMPPILLSPLKWLEKDVPNFYFQYGQHLLLEHEIDA
jgi:tetratricopeptide (TPR) repeat protein